MTETTPLNPSPRSYQVGCKTTGDVNWASNALRFATPEAAEQYGLDLRGRWTSLSAYEVHPSEEEPNHG